MRYKEDGSYIPECRAEARYEVEVSDSFFEVDLDSWQDDRGQYLYQAISFAWSIPAGEAETVEVTYGNHSGVECAPDFDGS